MPFLRRLLFYTFSYALLGGLLVGMGLSTIYSYRYLYTARLHYWAPHHQSQTNLAPETRLFSVKHHAKDSARLKHVIDMLLLDPHHLNLRRNQAPWVKCLSVHVMGALCVINFSEAFLTLTALEEKRLVQAIALTLRDNTHLVGMSLRHVQFFVQARSFSSMEGEYRYEVPLLIDGLLP